MNEMNKLRLNNKKKRDILKFNIDKNKKKILKNNR